MTQFNLLPDIKLQYLKAERTKRIVISLSIIVTGVAVVLVVGLYLMNVVQKNNINNLSSDITTQSRLIGGQANLGDILTIQNQIQTLTTLHEQEPAASNLANYLNELIPTAANISTLTIDFDADTITVSGTADSLATINQLVDSLKFATYSVQGTPGSSNAFSSVVLTSFGLTQAGGGSSPQQNASYTINCNYAPTLFNITEAVTLNVPTKVTTRSELGQPSILFKPNPASKSTTITPNGG